MKPLTALSIAAASSNGTSFPAPRREHVLREEVRRRDHGAPGGDGKGQRTGRDLLRVAVRRQEDIGGVEKLSQLGDGEKAIVELDVIRDAEVDRASLEEEPILLSLQPRHLRVGSPGDEVQHLGMTLHDRRQRRNRRLDALPWRDEPERREDET